MIDLSSLPKIVGKKKKRVGRGLGSNRGAKSGRGTTRHQKAREDIPIGFEGGQNPVIKRFPLLRGKGRNKPVSPKPLIVHLDWLNKFKDNEEVTIEKLVEKKIIDDKVFKVGAKLVRTGKLERKGLIIKFPASKGAAEEVEKLGGKVEA